MFLLTTVVNFGVSACDPGFYGLGCQSVCQCYEGNTVSCDAVDGTCLCIPGWTGHECTLCKNNLI